MRIAVAMAAIIASALAAPAAAEPYYCLADTDIGWYRGEVRMWVREDDDDGLGGWNEFSVDTDTGEWWGRTVGSRAGVTEGGTFEILSDGTGYGADWIGVGEGGFTVLRIDLSQGDIEQGHPYLRSDRHQAVHVGFCRPKRGRTFFDGVERGQ